MLVLERQTLQSGARLTVELTIFVQFCSRKGRNRANSLLLNYAPSIESEEIALDVVIYFDGAGSVVGVEVDLASSKVNLKNLDLKGLPILEVAAQ